MSNSSLVNYTKLSPFRQERFHVIDTITIHHCAGDVSVEALGDIFSNPDRYASSNYGIGSDGRIAMFVPEEYHAWTSGNSDNDDRAITIEVANNSGAPDWTISEAAYKSLIDLLVDICKRNNIPKLRWKNDPNLIGKVDQQNMTVHMWFQATACPGPYLFSKMGQIAADVNLRLEGPMYRVQVGAFKVKSNADAYLKKVQAAGFKDAYITTTGNDASVIVDPKDISVGSKVKIVKDAKDYSGTQLADSMFDITFEVSEISGDRVVITKDGVVMAAMCKTDLFSV